MSKRNNLEMKVISLVLSNLERIPNKERRLAVLDYIRGNLEFFTEEQLQTAQKPSDERQLSIPAIENGQKDYPGEFG